MTDTMSLWKDSIALSYAAPIVLILGLLALAM